MSHRSHTILILAYVLALLLIRPLAASAEIYHFQPYIALFFCLAATRKGRWLIVPAVAYLLSTMIAVGGLAFWMIGPVLAFALIIAFGNCFKKVKNPAALLGGSIGGAAVFHLVTNGAMWLTSGRYPLSWNGLVQATWTGLPIDVLPTWTFFRNDCVSTLLFSAIFLLLQRVPHSKAEAPALVPSH